MNPNDNSSRPAPLPLRAMPVTSQKKNSPLYWLYAPEVFFYTTIWLIVLVVVGTLAQKDVGIYVAQEKYFSSWFLWLGDAIPLPGGRLTLTVMFVNLAAKLFLDSPWTLAKIGVIISHGGALLLLIGGFFTAYFSMEGAMPIPETGRSNFFQDYHSFELAVIDTTAPTHDEVTGFSREHVKPGATIRDDAFPMTFKVLEIYANCNVVRRTHAAPATHRSMAQRFELQESLVNPEEHLNRGGMVVEIKGLDAERDGQYILYEFMEVPQTLSTPQANYELVLWKKRHPVPFEIELIDFEKKMHPGTGMASSYKSVVNLIDGPTPQRVVIEMNAPLRHKGYTFYQASFQEGADRDVTVLAVVKNAGVYFPYISSIVMCIGLLVHIVIQIPRLIQKMEARKPE
jgi:hypothetical protein